MAAEESGMDLEEQPEPLATIEVAGNEDEPDSGLVQAAELQEPEDREIDDLSDKNEPKTAAELEGKMETGADFIIGAFDGLDDEAEAGGSFDNEENAAVLFIPEAAAPITDVSFEITQLEIDEALLETDEALGESLNELLEPLEPDTAEAAAGLVEQIAQIAAGKDYEEEPDAKKEELEQVCLRLVETIGLDLDEETVSRFVEGILLENVDIQSSEYFSDQDAGTREKKLVTYLIARNLSLLAGAQTPSHKLLGRYALGASLFGTNLLSQAA
jgi:hypothetical protein